MNQASGSLEISAPNDVAGTPSYQPSFTLALTATHGGTQISGSIDLTFVDDEPVPVATISMAPETVNEGENIEVEISLTPATISGRVNFAVTAADGVLSGTPPPGEDFTAGETTVTVTLTAADNSVQNDGAREVTFALGTSTNLPYTLGTPSSVTVTVRDDDTPPLAPENLRAQAGNTEARLTWQAPLPSTPDHGQPVLRYESRVKVGSAAFGNWTTILNSDATTTSHTFTGLANYMLHTYEVRAENVAGGGTEAQVMVTPIVGVAVSFGAATLSVDEGGTVTVTVTLAAAPAAGTTVTVPIAAAGPGAGEVAGVPANVIFNAGETSKSFTVTTVEDTDDEPDEVLTLSLGTLPAGYVPGTHAQLELTVVDDDHPIVSATFGAATASSPEGGSVEVTVGLSQAPEREVVLPIVARRGANLAAAEVEGVPASVPAIIQGLSSSRGKEARSRTADGARGTARPPVLESGTVVRPPPGPRPPSVASGSRSADSRSA